MNKLQLQKANDMAAKIASQKQLLNQFENGKIESVVMRCFDTNPCTFSDVRLSGNLMPRTKIKAVVIEHLKAELAESERNFERFMEKPIVLEPPYIDPLRDVEDSPARLRNEEIERAFEADNVSNG